MRRSFPILALVAGLSLVSGLISRGEVPGPLLAIEFAAILWTHGLAAIHLESTGRRVEAMAIEGGLPDWVQAQAEKNWRKLSLYLWSGLPLFLLVTLIPRKGWVGEVWLMGLLAFNLAFQVGAFVAEFAIMTAQARLVRDVEGWIKSGQGLVVSKKEGSSC